MTDENAISSPPPSLPSPSLDDNELVAALRRGDTEAATAAYRRLRPIVARTIARLLGYGDRDVEDLEQLAMIEVITTIGRFRGDCSLNSWASTVAAHAVFKHIRRRKLERRIFDATPPEDRPIAARGDVAQEHGDRHSLARIQKHIDGMDPLKAWTYLLHDVAGYDLREVAEITEASVAAAQSRLVRGRRELHDRIAADPELRDLRREQERRDP